MKARALFIAQPTYAKIGGRKTWEDLPRATTEAGQLAAELEKHGYQLGYQNLLHGGEVAEVTSALNCSVETL